MRERLYQTLINLRYESATGRGQRGLMKHHVDAIMGTILPVVQDETAARLKAEVRVAELESALLKADRRRDSVQEMLERFEPAIGFLQQSLRLEREITRNLGIGGPGSVGQITLEEILSERERLAH